MTAFVFAPGFFSSQEVHIALLAGGVVAVVSGAVGVFTVIRGQSFAGHSLSDMGTLGGSTAYFMNVGPLWGYLFVGLAVGAAMEAIGVERRRGRDVATGIVLGAALGLAALLLYLDTTQRSTTGATVTILFGSLFTVSPSTVPAMVVLAVVGVGCVASLFRPLLLSSISADLASARGIPVRRVGLAFLLLIGVSMALSAMVVGTILATALLIGPAATALRVSRRPVVAVAVSGAIGVVCVWLGVLLAYDSYYWPPARHGWPVSFFVVAIVFVVYFATDLLTRSRERRPTAAELACDEHETTAADGYLVRARTEPEAAGG